tara:strand:- start:62 stop:346 length:285 start_codon:yes stop_codon:yes gene_type:complete
MIGKLDSNGLLLGWYLDTDTVEEPKVTVTQEVWQQALEINANKYVDGNFVFEDLRTDEQKANDNNEIANRKSGIAKLKELGLTDAQIKALIGVE